MKSIKTVGFALIVFIMSCNFAQSDCLLIGNSSVTETSISKGDVKRIFLGKMKKWANDTKIHPVTLKSGPVHEAFVKKYINKSPSTFSTFWRRAIVSGTGIPPKSFKTEREVVKYITGTEGAVGYISSDTIHDDVKVINIEK